MQRHSMQFASIVASIVLSHSRAMIKPHQETMCVLQMHAIKGIFEGACDALFALICVAHEATPLARLINNATLCKLLVGILIQPIKSAEGTLNMVRATTKKPVKKSAAKKSAAKKGAVKKSSVKKTARKAVKKAVKKATKKTATKKYAAKKSVAKKATKKAPAKKGPAKKAAAKKARKPVVRKPSPPPPSAPETA
jgi:hypothetical protein